MRPGCPGGKIQWSLEEYIDHALLLTGSSFTVGIVDEGLHNPAAHTRVCTPESFHVPIIVSGVIHATPTQPETVHVMPSRSVPVYVMPAQLDTVQVMPAKSESLQAMPAKPESLQVMPATPESLHKMADTSEPSAKMAAMPEL
ncbi:hypothetical protein DPX16_11833 [Anabarilius grahami]|uniref:Uncharacterized protein n=1 Tax=Anabarilius grahami TaxID=495550 RepID=A0A3N0Z9N5_ANAGA|nr:hypothetical protein DPX16_11833 [Anabarilius grahami]